MVSKHTRNQYLSTFAASLAGFCMGSSMAFSSPSRAPLTSGLDQYIHLSSDQYGHYASILNLGGVLGSIVCAFLMRYFGRRFTLIFGVVAYCSGWGLLISGRTYPWLLLARCIKGIGVGSSLIASPTYIAEISSVNIRGKLCSSYQIMVCVGVLFNYCLPLMTNNFRYMAASNVAVPILHLVLLFIICKESPISLLSRDKEAEAKQSLVHFSGQIDIEERFKTLKSFIHDSKNEHKSILSIVKDRSFKGPFVMMLFVLFFFHFSGINPVIFNLNQIFQSVEWNLPEVVSPIIVGILQVFFTILAGFIVDKWGRKRLLIVSTSVMGIAMAILGVYFYITIEMYVEDSRSIDWLPLISVCVYFAGFSFGMGPVPWIILGEVFLPGFKESATSIAIGASLVFSYAATALYIPLLGWINLYGVFWMHGGFCFLSIAYNYFKVIETKGKTPQEIAHLFVS